MLFLCQTQAADRRAKRVSGGVLAAAQLAAKSMMEDGGGRWRSTQKCISGNPTTEMMATKSADIFSPCFFLETSCQAAVCVIFC